MGLKVIKKLRDKEQRKNESAMQKHTKVYLKYYKIGEQDKPLCEYCNAAYIVDIHHINGRGKGKDVIENLMGLCRYCHNLATEEKLKKQDLWTIHASNLKTH